MVSPDVQPAAAAVACAVVYALYAWATVCAFTAFVSARLVTAFWYDTYELRLCLGEAGVNGAGILRCQHLACSDRLSRLDVDRSHLSRACEVEIGLAVGSEVP